MSSNKLDQRIDINGSLIQTSNLELSNEPLKLGSLLSSGNNASISGQAPLITISNLTGLTTNLCSVIKVSNSIYPSNNGIFSIISKTDSSVIINNPNATTPDGYLLWEEYNLYSLEDDLNYIRTDRELIKGVNYYDSVPDYESIDGNIHSTNLANISGKTTDAKSIVINKKWKESVTINTGDSFITLSDIGKLKHSTSDNLVGIPIIDGYDSSNRDACFVALIQDGYSNEIVTLWDQYTGVKPGMRVFGLTRKGNSLSPNSIEVAFYAVKPGASIDTAVPYVWEITQSVEVYYGWRDSLYSIADTAFRTLMINGVIFGGSGTSGGGGSGTDLRLPSPTAPGQILMSHDGSTWSPTVPVTDGYGNWTPDTGYVVIDGDGFIVGTPS